MPFQSWRLQLQASRDAEAREPRLLRHLCQDDHEGDCALAHLRNPWERECRYPAAELCLRTCGLCHRVLLASRCQLPTDASPRFFTAQTVDWGEFFEGMLSRAKGQVHRGGGSLLSEKPWLAEFPHFLSGEEADRLVQIAEGQGLEQEDELPSKIRNVYKKDCESANCLLDPLISEVYRRTSALVGIPPQHFESIEFLKYGRSQHYLEHTDPDPRPLLEQDDWEVFRSGLRVLTVFFYFTDVEEGGETTFPNAGVTVKPSKGKAVIWSNVGADWWQASLWAEHQSLPVKRGLKYAANFWVHPFDYRMPARYAEGTHCS